METTEIRPGVFLKHHEAGTCKGGRCPLHNPSDHALRSLPLDWNGEVGCMTRLLGDVQIPDPDDYKILSGQTVIWRNSAICNLCSDEIVSEFRWDYKTCKCGKAMVDGGHDYLRRTVSDITDTSIILNPKEK